MGRMVMDELRGLHQVAYVRFASVYREFKDVTEFMQVLQEFMHGTRKDNEGKETADEHGASKPHRRSAARQPPLEGGLGGAEGAERL